MPLVTTKDVHGFRTVHRYRLRCLPGDVFAASAMAIESHLSGATIEAPLAASSVQDIRNMRGSSMIEHLKQLTDGVLSREIAGSDLFNVHPQIHRMLQQLLPDQFEESMQTEFTLARRL